MASYDGKYTLVTVFQSWPGIAADGATMLVLNTLELGPIAFAVTPQSIAAIRLALAQCEVQASAGKGRA